MVPICLTSCELYSSCVQVCIQEFCTVGREHMTWVLVRVAASLGTYLSVPKYLPPTQHNHWWCRSWNKG